MAHGIRDPGGIKLPSGGTMSWDFYRKKNGRSDSLSVGSGSGSSLPSFVNSLNGEARLEFEAAKYGSDRMAQSAQEANEMNMQLAEETRKFNAAEAAKNRDFQLMMSNTAHQREMQDLIKAGLNPHLTATGGQGASTASGATATGTAATVQPTVTTNPFSGIATTALNQRRLEQERRRLGLDERAQALAERRYNELETRTAMENWMNARSIRQLNSAEAVRAQKQAQQAIAQANYTKAQQSLTGAQRREIYSRIDHLENVDKNFQHTWANLDQDTRNKVVQEALIQAEIRKSDATTSKQYSDILNDSLRTALYGVNTVTKAFSGPYYR